MGDVLDFPTSRQQGLAFLEQQLRQLLIQKGADEHLIEFACEQLLDIYQRINASEQYTFSVRLPDGLAQEDRDDLQLDINTGLEGVRKENHALLVELIAQLVLAKVKLFQHERAD